MILKNSLLIVIIILFFPFIFTQDTFCLQSESAHFIYYYEATDSSIIDTVKLRLENSFDRITKDLQLTITEKIKVHIYPNLQELHNAIGYPDAPDWLVGVGNVEIYVVSPLNPGPSHTYKSIMDNVFIHEFTHICVGKIRNYLPSWLNEGFALYEGGPYYDTAAVVSAYNKLGKIPTLDELYYDFVKYSGYQFAITIAYFIIENYGMDAMRKFIHNPEDYSVFSGLSKNEFEVKWHEYVKKNYLGNTSTISPDKDDHSQATGFILKQNYPNPFNAGTVIHYNIPGDGETKLTIYNSIGEKICTLINSIKNAGEHSIYWNGLDDFGQLAANGIYIYNLRTGNASLSKKMIVLK